MIPPSVTLAQAGGFGRPAAMLPPAGQPGAYLRLFRPCDCGHSSAWHSGAFGAEWRAGQQVRGACEADSGRLSAACGCTAFSDSNRSA